MAALGPPTWATGAWATTCWAAGTWRTDAAAPAEPTAGPGVPKLLRPKRKPDDKEDELIVLEMI